MISSRMISDLGFSEGVINFLTRFDSQDRSFALIEGVKKELTVA
jgi:hypothetical protein